MKLPTPQFSNVNPYWKRLVVAGVLEEYQPRLNWQDFLYASSWEMQAPDLHGAHCVRLAAQFGYRVSMQQAVRNQIKELIHDEKHT